MATLLIERLGRKTTNAAVYGGKASGLGRLIELGHRVPPGFALSTRALADMIRHLGLHSENETLAASMAQGTPDLVLARQIQDALLAGRLPESLRQKLHDAVAALDAPGELILRSSASVEDSINHSYAGIFESLRSTDTSGLAHALKAVWASVYSPRALTYASASGVRSVPEMAVVVQAFLDAERSGVMFTTFPNPDGVSDTLVEHVEGTAEKLVTGQVTPQRAWLRSPDVEGDRLDASHADELRRLSDLLERQFGSPQDVEWCIYDGSVHVVQTRPITTSTTSVDTTQSDAPILLSGTGASPGVGSGEVHIAMNVEQALELTSGKVLVTSMTNPDMVVAMRNAVAIVTDVGGMVCHAAIVSRELQVPCVVGTGTATETLVDSQVVTVDGGRGTVLSGNVTAHAGRTPAASPSDLWEAWQSQSLPDHIPRVATMALLTDAPSSVATVSYLIDIDLRCDRAGLWRPLTTQEDIDHTLDELLARLATLAEQRELIEVCTAGAVANAQLEAAVLRLGSRKIALGDPNDGIPIAGGLTKTAEARNRLPRVDEAIAKTLDPTNGPGPMPHIQPAPMPDPVARGRWWDLLSEYGRYHSEHRTGADHGTHTWAEIRPEVITSPMLKSLVQPGFEMVPRVLGFAGASPMHTKWIRGRFNVRADAFGPTWAQLVHATWDPTFMEDFLLRVRRSYDQLAEIVELFPTTDDDAAALAPSQIVALLTAWWPRWVEFFALCLFIQAQGEAVLYPVVAETIEANLADIGDPPDGAAWPGSADLIAPTTPVLSAEYMGSVGRVRACLDQAGLDGVDAATDLLRSSPNTKLGSEVQAHLDRWHWMRDRDLPFEPWDTAERVIETALRTDPHPVVPYEQNLERNLVALAFHSDLAEGSGRAGAIRHAVRFLQDLNVERENHHVLWLKYSYPLRSLILEVERRLRLGDEELDSGIVFYLQAPEMIEALHQLPEPLPGRLVELARLRRRAYRHETHLERVDPATLETEDDYF